MAVMLGSWGGNVVESNGNLPPGLFMASVTPGSTLRSLWNKGLHLPSPLLALKV